MTVSDCLEQQKSFTISFDRAEVLTFQQNFWFFIDYLKTKNVPWFSDVEADDHGMCWFLLGYVWKYDLPYLVLRFETKERYLGYGYDEDTDEWGIMLKDVYGFRLDIETSLEDADFSFEYFKENDYQPDLSGLLTLWGK